MEQIKKAAPVFIAFLILCFLVAMPPAFGRIQEKTLLNRVTIEEIPENILIDNSKKELTVAEKMELILNGRMGTGGAIMLDGGFSGMGTDADIEKKAYMELEKLMHNHAILEFDMSDVYLTQGEPLNFVDMSDMSRSVSVMWIHLAFPSMEADVMMDIETSQIYEYNLYGMGVDMLEDENGAENNSYAEDMMGDADLVLMDEMIRNFMDYTGLSEEEFDYFYDCSELPWYMGLRYYTK